MFLVSSCSCICPIYWSRVLGREWRCSWSSCCNYIWVINKYVVYQGASNIRGFMVFFLFLQNLWCHPMRRRWSWYGIEVIICVLFSLVANGGVKKRAPHNWLFHNIYIKICCWQCWVKGSLSSVKMVSAICRILVLGNKIVENVNISECFLL